MTRKRKVRVPDDSTASSDDEVLARCLREATDARFLNESLFQKSNDVEEDPLRLPANTELEPSRRNLKRLDQFQEFGVTQSFKNFVAKKLSKALDRDVLEDDKARDGLASMEEREKRDNDKVGIKLLRSSNFALTGERKECKIGGRCRTIEMRENAAGKLKFQEAAVDPEWILSKISTKAWANVRKGTMFKYKRLKNGILVECD